MRDSLKELINNTIIYKYDLPNDNLSLANSDISLENDICYGADNIEGLIDIIYNSVVEYSFNEYDLERGDYENLLARALITKIKYKTEASDTVKIKYGFYGEVLLYALLVTKFGANPLISRGYFYNPLENAETKGYDSYHLLDTGTELQLWFGEAKFHGRYDQGINSILSSLHNALSDQYLDTNLLAISTRIQDFNISGSRIEEIIQKWEDNPHINLLSELKTENIKLVYPILLLYEQGEKDYDEMIKEAIDYIKGKEVSKTFNITVDFSIFFIFLPIKEVKEVKQEVIKCIELKKPLI